MSTKKDRTQFIKNVSTFLIKMGAVKNDERWELQTNFGLLSLFIDETHYKHAIGTVFTRFAEPARAKEVCCNPYSGKWNHHYFDAEKWSAASALENFMFQILSILPEWVQKERAELVPNYRLVGA
jgi:hypothetical protein